MNNFAAILVVLAAAVNAGPSRLQGAVLVKGVCNALADGGSTRVRARATSWEADGSGDDIRPRRIADKVAAEKVTVAGKAKYVPGETLYGFLGQESCGIRRLEDDTRELGASWGGTRWSGSSWTGSDGEENFQVVFGEDGFGSFRYMCSQYVASDLVDAGMTLNLRDANGDSQICCTFEEPESNVDIEGRLLNADQN